MDDNVGADSIKRARERLPVVVMGPAGCGKTTLGRRLAAVLGARFIDADDYHSPENVEKMRAGISLTDTDRAPWLAHLRALMDAEPKTVLACSALKRSYRTALSPDGAQVFFLFLDVPPDELERRLNERAGHYAGTTLLGSQLATLERPIDETNTIHLDGTRDLEDLVESAISALGNDHTL